MLVTGDFGGIWRLEAAEEENYWLDWLSKKKFTTCFVDGNHENFDRLLSGEFPTVNFHGGKAKKIRNGVYYLMRGNVYEFEGKKFFCMGGASSYDIKDGILDPERFQDVASFVSKWKRWEKQGKKYRINHVSWWEEEIPHAEEMVFAEQNLAKHDFTVDYVISHCLPTSVAVSIFGDLYQPDALTNFFGHLIRDKDLAFLEWHCGHYHRELYHLPGYFVHYNDITRLL